MIFSAIFMEALESTCEEKNRKKNEGKKNIPSPWQYKLILTSQKKKPNYKDN
jgi:hypothetical protein